MRRIGPDVFGAAARASAATGDDFDAAGAAAFTPLATAFWIAYRNLISGWYAIIDEVRSNLHSRLAGRGVAEPWCSSFTWVKQVYARFLVASVLVTAGRSPPI
jgi:hypothetical protein